MNIPDLSRCSVNIGDRFERLEVLTLLKMSNGKTGAEVICTCGNRLTVFVNNLKQGITRSCGCYQIDRTREVSTTHNGTGNLLLHVHLAMLSRCNNRDNKSYENYGGRGITVCDRWSEPDGKGFLNFLEDMGERPEGMTLDRIDVNGNYYKENCRWADSSTQSYNTRVRKDNSSGVPGVRKSRNGLKWIARITVNKLQIYLGTFLSFEAACKARDDAEIKYFGVKKIRNEIHNLYEGGEDE